MKYIENINHIGEKVKRKIAQVFNTEELNKLARKVGFVQRSSSKLQGRDFIELMTTELIANASESLDGLCDILSKINSKAKMSAQALSQRINKEESVEYLKKVFDFSLKENFQSLGERIPIELLEPFNKVLIEDSTKIELNEKLADEFKGSGGCASKSGLKINLIYELKKKFLQEISINSGNKPDQSEKGVFQYIHEKDLIIRDLGYFTLESFDRIIKQLAFFLSRLFKNVNVYLSDNDNASSINLPEYLDKEFFYQTVIDLDVYLGTKKIPSRLIAYRLPEEIVNERRRKAKKSAKKKAEHLRRTI